MRAGNWNVAIRALNEGRSIWLLRQAGKYLAIQASSLLDTKPLAGPLMGALVTTYRCNERCLMCDLPFRAESSDRRELSTEEWFAVIDDMAASGTSGIGITGGEPLIRQDTPALVKRIRSYGLPVTVNTNGLLLNKQKILESLLEADPTNINISMDAVTGSSYDHLRGLNGAWDLLQQAFGKLVHRREELSAGTTLTAVCVLSPHNVVHIEKIMSTWRKLGFDAIGFMPVHEIKSVHLHHKESDLQELWGDAVRRQNLDALTRAMELLIRRKKGSGDHLQIDNSRTYMEMFPLAFLGQDAPIACVAGYANSFVDPYGDVFPCWPFLEQKAAPIGNIRHSSWKELWHSAEYQKERKNTAACRKCFWNCQQEINAMFRRPEKNGIYEARKVLNSLAGG